VKNWFQSLLFKLNLNHYVAAGLLLIAVQVSCNSLVGAVQLDPQLESAWLQPLNLDT
jgi:hypothetical protein